MKIHYLYMSDIPEFIAVTGARKRKHTTGVIFLRELWLFYCRPEPEEKCISSQEH